MDYNIDALQCISKSFMELNRRMPAIVMALILILSAGLIFQWSLRASAFAGINGKIVFQRGQWHSSQIFIVNDDGTDEKQLTHIGPDNSFPHWSPDGKKIVFASDRYNGKWEIFIMDIKDSTERRLTYNLDYDDFEPSWSPDGTKIIFTSNRFGYEHIYVLDLITGRETRLTDDTLYAGSSGAVWSPDGKKIAFHACLKGELGKPELYVMDANGKNPIRLTHNPYTELGYGCNGLPCWSPDGTKIAFTSMQSIGVTKICIMDPFPGATPIPLTQGMDWEYYPCWSPDGTKIAFSRQRGGGPWSGPLDIYVLDLSSGVEQHLIEDGSAPEWQPQPVKVTVDPSTLNLKSKGNWVTAYIELPPGHDVRQIEVSTIMLNGKVKALAKPTVIGDYDHDGVSDLMVKFDRDAVQALFKKPGIYMIVITGKINGVPFLGTATIKVI